MPKSLTALLLAVFAVDLANSASAGPITYTVTPETLSGGYAITGTITTDGTIGPLAASDITGFSWTATGSPTFSESFSDPSSVSALNVTATATTLYLQYTTHNNGQPSQTYGDLALSASGGNFPGVVFETLSLTQSGITGWSRVIAAEPNNSNTFTFTHVDAATVTPSPPSTLDVFATVVPAPEPASLTLVGTAFLLLGGKRFLRRQG